MIRRFLNNYLPRHTNRINRALHLVGVPLTFIGTPWTFIAGAAWYYPLGCFIGGYVLQLVGHVIEGNDAGEVVFLKQKLGMPYTEYAPGGPSSSPSENAADSTSAD
jgi:hypothetical protein